MRLGSTSVNGRSLIDGENSLYGKIPIFNESIINDCDLKEICDTAVKGSEMSANSDDKTYWLIATR